MPNPTLDTYVVNLLIQSGLSKAQVERYQQETSSKKEDNDKNPNNSYSLASRAIRSLISSITVQKEFEKLFNQQMTQEHAASQLRELQELMQKAKSGTGVNHSEQKPQLTVEQNQSLLNLIKLLSQIKTIDTRLNDALGKAQTTRNEVNRAYQSIEAVQQKVIDVVQEERQKVITAGGQFEHQLTESEQRNLIIDLIKDEKPITNNVSSIGKLLATNQKLLEPTAVKRFDNAVVKARKELASLVEEVSKVLTRAQAADDANKQDITSLWKQRESSVQQYNGQNPNITMQALKSLFLQPKAGRSIEEAQKDASEVISHFQTRSTIKV